MPALVCFSVCLFVFSARLKPNFAEIVSHIHLLHSTTSERFIPTGTADDSKEKNVRRRVVMITALVFVNTDVKVAADG